VFSECSAVMTSDKMAEVDSQSDYLLENVTSSGDVNPPPPPPSSLISARFIVPVAALAALNLVVIVGNSLVIAAVFTYRKLRTITNTFIVSLAVADLLLGAVVLPFSSVNEVLGWWPFGRVWCSAWLAIDVWVCTASILNLCAISLDRYLAISRPFRYPLIMSPTRAKVAVAVVWTLALAICLPPLFGWRESEIANVDTVVSTKHECASHNEDHNLGQRAKTDTHFTIDEEIGKRNQIKNRTLTFPDAYYSDMYGYQSTIETNFLNGAKRRTTPIAPSLWNSSNRHRIGDEMYDREFVRKSGSSLTVDASTDVAELKSRRTSCRSGSGVECREMMSRRSGDWDLDSGIMSVDLVTSTASFNACRAAASAPLPACMLTSEPGYIIYSACGSFWIPMLVMVFFYVKIYRTAVKTNGQRTHGAELSREDLSKAGIMYEDYHNCMNRTYWRQAAARCALVPWRN